MASRTPSLASVLALATVLVGLFALPLGAQEPAARESATAAATSFGATREEGLSEGRFFIESVLFEGLQRASAALLLNQSLLEEGQVYSESELRDAVHRIERLPFVLSADFALRKGSERGRYQLAVAVEETKRFFFGENLVVTYLTNSVNFDSLLFSNISFSPGGLVGMRFFAGDSDVFFVSAAADRGYQAGWSHYGLVDGRGVVSLAFEQADSDLVEVFPLGVDPTFSSWRSDGGAQSVRLALGLPLGVRSGFRAEALYLQDDRGERKNLLGQQIFGRTTLEYEDLERLELEVAWTYDTTDDPLFPQSGLQLDAALDWQSLEARLFVPPSGLFEPEVVLPPGIGTALPTMSSEQLRAAFTISQHWRLAPRISTSVSARVAVGRAEVTNLPVFENLVDPGADRLLDLVSDELDLVEGHFAVEGSFDLWGPRLTRSKGDLRLTLGATYGYDETSPDLGLADNPLYRKTISTGIVFRNSWGLFRAAFQIADYGRGD